MMNLEALQRFSKAISILQECDAPGKLSRALPEAMQMLFPANSHVVNWIGPTAFEDMSVSSVPLPREASLEIFNAHVGQHPLLWAIEDAWKSRRPRAGRWSDHTSLQKFRQTAIYHDFFRHTDTAHQLGVTLQVSEKAVLGLSINRERTDFKPEDVQVAELFMTHVGEVVQSMIGRSKLENIVALQESALNDTAVAVVDDSHRLLFATEQAREMMRSYFQTAKDDGLPTELYLWLRDTPLAGESLTRQTDQGTLNCTCEPITRWEENLMHTILTGREAPRNVRSIRFRENRQAERILSLKKLGITPREAEVLYWIMEGKSNSDIAIILGLGARTVGKHCENLFNKLEVENRTAAASLAREAI